MPLETDFNKQLRRRDDEGGSYQRDYLSPAPPRFADAGLTTLLTSQSALHQRDRICLLIETGLSLHGDRLDPDYWRGVEADLWAFDPSFPGFAELLTVVIEETRQFAVQQSGNHGVWNLIEAASVQMWAKDVVRALEQYRRVCEA
jgi:hypothetical protein